MLEIFVKYMGTGLITIEFLAAVCYLFLQEKSRPCRILFAYSPIIVLLLFFNPWFFQIFAFAAEEEIYFRMMWLLPVGIVIAYAVVSICISLQGKRRVAFGIVAAVVIAVSGKLVYSSPLYSKAENMYHMPQAVVDICDAIEIPGREVMAAFPDEFILYVRQYSPLVCMPYGRETLMTYYHEMDALINSEEIVASELAKMAKQYSCHYVILSEETILHGEMTDYDYVVFDKMHGYVIYKDITMNFSLEAPKAGQ